VSSRTDDGVVAADSTDNPQRADPESHNRLTGRVCRIGSLQGS